MLPHDAHGLLSRSCNLLHLMSSRWAETRAGVVHFHSHFLDESSVTRSPNYEAVCDMQPPGSPGRKGKNTNVAGAVAAVLAAQESSNPLSSFLPTVNQANTTRRHTVMAWDAFIDDLLYQLSFPPSFKYSQCLSEHLLLFHSCPRPG